MMPWKTTVFGWITLFALLLIAHGCGGSSAKPAGGAATSKLYLQNNIHAQAGPRDIKASYANWTDPGAGHLIIPVNTPVEFKKYRKGLIIKNLIDGRQVFFEFHPRNMGMSAEEYIPLITSPSTVSLKGLSGIDRKGIQEGKAYVGMTKEGVRVALGYPAAHRTPSLESGTWIYWKNRFKTIAVEFSADGQVQFIR
ncbi:MAG: hypothetical protein JSW39_24435 [Desulfobacterales bacterium]|nr:MAG: hypothetical protein JSW39_24435 [Desulfobacterales bacterium]